MKVKLPANRLSTLLGQFTPSNLGSRLFMERSELETPEKFLVWFHERFHYLQIVFTPVSYTHLTGSVCHEHQHADECGKH